MAVPRGARTRTARWRLVRAAIIRSAPPPALLRRHQVARYGARRKRARIRTAHRAAAQCVRIRPVVRPIECRHVPNGATNTRARAPTASTAGMSKDAIARHHRPAHLRRPAHLCLRRRLARHFQVCPLGLLRRHRRHRRHSRHPRLLHRHPGALCRAVPRHTKCAQSKSAVQRRRTAVTSATVGLSGCVAR